ncbi:MAG: hypothetical protein ACI4XH_08120, partial [Acutalibacteraceae bacterium]
NRGNRFISLCSMASKSRGLNEWLRKNKGADYDITEYPFNQGDVVTTMIKCANGETITLHHDCSLPRPYSRNYVVEGTKGIYQETKDGKSDIFLDEFKENSDNWQEFQGGGYREKYEHPLWAQYENDGIREQGHGGMDFLVLNAFVESAINDAAAPIDVYDTAAWMAVTALSEQSIALGSMPVAFPDFTNGAWIDREPFRRGKYCLDDVCEEFFK